MPASKPTRARALRARALYTEVRLWDLLRGRRLDGQKFRRQVAVGPYVVDFVCLERRLIVEADGPLHDAIRDIARDDWLGRQGFRVLRLDNTRINEHPELAMDDIRRALGEPPNLSGPLAES
ncbi:endonuclease domain-containing protein [Phenylobacterium sp.]|uniref:endonuclease domain-containing protein n=1 Tax=Phenylobacterium sp. TaxID=1871053 RepID=UPI002727EF96|nr:endonuclease domain-containing protein [Phenylobacterium sp.]MDO8800991.1 endonuclease domain-containing protein [Phenylobacterium sp.]